MYSLSGYGDMITDAVRMDAYVRALRGGSSGRGVNRNPDRSDR